MGPTTEFTSNVSATPRAGWYDDPEWPGQKRYWDGARWIDRRVPAPPVAAPVRTRATPAGWYDDPAAPGGTRYWDGTQWALAPTPSPVGVPTVPTVPTYATGAAEAALAESADRLPPRAEVADEAEAEAGAGAAAPEPEPERPPSARDTMTEVAAVEVEAAPGAGSGSLVPEPESADLEEGDVGAALPTAADESADEVLEPASPPPPPGSSGVSVPSGFRLSPPEEPSDLPASAGVATPWYRRRATGLIGGLALIGLLVFVTVRACGGPQGATPEPGVFRGSGDDGFAIEFTVTPAGDVTDLEFDARSDTITMEGAHVDESLPVDDGTFDVTLRDGLGLQVITIEGRFTDGGTAAAGSFHIELAPGVEVQSGGDPNASGSWRAELAGGG